MGDARQPPGRRAALPRAQREDLILDRAGELFYARGIRAVGMDELIADLGLSKMTVYRLFPTKDVLVARYLQRLQASILLAVDADISAHIGTDPAAALTAVLDAVEQDLARPGFRGCPFGNAAVDYDDPAHPARTIAREYREQLRARLRTLSERLTDDTRLGDRIAVLIDGAYLNAAHLGPHGPAAAGLSLARELVAARTART
jgi:AcrR family transcriptional regulator